MWEGNTQDGGEVWSWEAAGKGEAPLSRGLYIQACPKESHPDALILVLNLLCVPHCDELGQQASPAQPRTCEDGTPMTNACSRQASPTVKQMSPLTAQVLTIWFLQFKHGF